MSKLPDTPKALCHRCGRPAKWLMKGALWCGGCVGRANEFLYSGERPEPAARTLVPAPTYDHRRFCDVVHAARVLAGASDEQGIDATADDLREPLEALLAAAAMLSVVPGPWTPEEEAWAEEAMKR